MAGVGVGVGVGVAAGVVAGVVAGVGRYSGEQDGRMNKKAYRVGIKQLVEFCCQRGDLIKQPQDAITAQQGIKAHRKVQKSRPLHYQSEVSITGDIASDTAILQLRGRIDGIFAELIPIIEEIKTIAINPEELPDNQHQLHLAQLRLYAWCYLRTHAIEHCLLRLTYYHWHTKKTSSIDIDTNLEDLDAYAEPIFLEYLSWLEQQSAYQNTRNHSIQSLTFPLPNSLRLLYASAPATT